MKMSSTATKRVAAGRPRTSSLTRTEQLRLAKRAQREREAKADQFETRIRLPNALAKRLQFAAQQPGFVESLTKFLNSEVIEINRFPQLKLLCWSRRSRYLVPQDAWSLYERNWRFVEVAQFEPAERQLVESLFARYGGGLIRD
jgi:hypothetical protein